MTARAHRILIPLAAFLSTLPILIKGPSCGHDFDFHVLSWLEASTQFAHLHYPHWAYTPAYNAGEPRFIFYPPLSWALGAILGLILPWTLVPAAFTFLALTLSGFTAHALARRYATPHAATLAAILYLLNPYMLFTAYERTAYGELLAAGWLPLLFAAALAPRIRIVPLAIPIALLWLTNAPAAVMSCYALAILTLIRLIFDDNRLRLAISTTTATILGLTLSAFYLLPAAYERRYIQSDMATIEGMRIVDNTLFHHMSPVTGDTLAHDVVLHTASVVAILILAAIVLAAATLWVPRPRGGGAGIGEADPSTEATLRNWFGARPLLVLTVLLAVLLTPISLPIWTHTPELRFLQFPWRLTAILSAILLIFAARAFTRLKLTSVRTAIAAAALAVALILPAWHTFNQPCDDEDTVQARVALYHSNLGTEPTDEYTPTNADNDALGKANPPYWLIAQAAPCDKPKGPNEKGFFVVGQLGIQLSGPLPPDTGPPPANSKPGQAPDHLSLHLERDCYLVLNRRDFPGWDIKVNGQPVLTSHPPYGPVGFIPPPRCETWLGKRIVDRPPTDRNDGLLVIELPAGHSIIDLAYHHTIDQSIGLILTLFAVIVALGLWLMDRKQTPQPSAFR